MMIARALLATIVTTPFIAVAAAQHPENEASGVEFEVATGEATIAEEHSHTDHAGHDGGERSMTVRTAPEEASATLDNVTWELLSRVAAQFLSGNRAALLSGNEPEVLSKNETKLVSDNKLELFSGNKISLFSNIQIEIHISGVPNPAEMMGGREIRVEAHRTEAVEESGAGHAESRESPRAEHRFEDAPRFEPAPRIEPTPEIDVHDVGPVIE